MTRNEEILSFIDNEINNGFDALEAEEQGNPSASRYFTIPDASGRDRVFCVTVEEEAQPPAEGDAPPATVDPESGIEGKCMDLTVHPYEHIQWDRAPESCGDGETWAWYGQCMRCGRGVVEFLVSDGEEEQED